MLRSAAAVDGMAAVARLRAVQRELVREVELAAEVDDLRRVARCGRWLGQDTEDAPALRDERGIVVGAAGEEGDREEKRNEGTNCGPHGERNFIKRHC